jgi:hypothetical protein
VTVVTSRTRHIDVSESSRGSDRVVTWVRDREGVHHHHPHAEHEEAPMTQHTFVLSRRVGRTPQLVERALATLTEQSHDGLSFVGPFEHWVLIGPWGTGPSERRAPAELDIGRRAPEPVEIEIGPWDRRAVEVRLRPLAKRPERWSARRQARYFDEAHDAVDSFVRAIEDAVPAPMPATALPATRTA